MDVLLPCYYYTRYRIASAGGDTLMILGTYLHHTNPSFAVSTVRYARGLHSVMLERPLVPF